MILTLEQFFIIKKKDKIITKIKIIIVYNDHDKYSDLCTLVSRNCVPFCKCIKRHVYPGNQVTHDDLRSKQISYRARNLKLLQFSNFSLLHHLSEDSPHHVPAPQALHWHCKIRYCFAQGFKCLLPKKSRY